MTDLHPLATAVPSAANASYYAQRVHRPLRAPSGGRLGDAEAERTSDIANAHDPEHCNAVLSTGEVALLSAAGGLGKNTATLEIAGAAASSTVEAENFARSRRVSTNSPRRPKLVLAVSRLARARHRRGFPCCFHGTM